MKKVEISITDFRQFYSSLTTLANKSNDIQTSDGVFIDFQIPGVESSLLSNTSSPFSDLPREHICDAYRYMSECLYIKLYL